MTTERVKAEVDRICATVPLATIDQIKVAIDKALAVEREACAEIALAIDSGRGNEKEIARAIRDRATEDTE